MRQATIIVPSSEQAALSYASEKRPSYWRLHDNARARRMD